MNLSEINEKFYRMNDDERRQLAECIRPHAPLPIPPNADITTAFVKPHEPSCFNSGNQNPYRSHPCSCDRLLNGYAHIKFEWSSGEYKLQARWHTKTPRAPYNQGIVWVLRRSKQHKEFVAIRDASSGMRV